MIRALIYTGIKWFGILSFARWTLSAIMKLVTGRMVHMVKKQVSKASSASVKA